MLAPLISCNLFCCCIHAYEFQVCIKRPGRSHGIVIDGCQSCVRDHVTSGFRKAQLKFNPFQHEFLFVQIDIRGNVCSDQKCGIFERATKKAMLVVVPVFRYILPLTPSLAPRPSGRSPKILVGAVDCICDLAQPEQVKTNHNQQSRGEQKE